MLRFFFFFFRVIQALECSNQIFRKIKFTYLLHFLVSVDDGYIKDCLLDKNIDSTLFFTRSSNWFFLVIYRKLVFLYKLFYWTVKLLLVRYDIFYSTIRFFIFS